MKEINFQQLQSEWQQEFAKQNNTITALLKNTKKSTIQQQTSKLQKYAISYLIFNLTISITSALFMIEQSTSLSIISGSIAILLSQIGFYKNVYQLHLIDKIKFNQPILIVQKNIETLKVARIKHNRFIFIFSNLYFWVALFSILNFKLEFLLQEVWNNAPSVLIIHSIFAVIWFPLSFWLLKKYEGKSSPFWNKWSKDSHLTDESVNASLNKALEHLEELKDFEEN